MEYSFVRSPIFNSWLSHNKPNKSLLICSPYFKKDAFERIIDCYNLGEDSNTVEVEVLIRGKLEDFIKGSSDISALESLIRLKSVDIGKVRRLTNLHMKAYLIDRERLLIGSGNCTQNGLFAKSVSGNVEGAIATMDMALINDFSSYYSDLIPFSESLDIFYDEISEGYDKYIDKYIPDIGNEVLSLVSKSEKRLKYKFSRIPAGYTLDTTDADMLVAEGHESIFQDISIEAIPQFSNLDDACYRVVEILVNQDDPGLTFVELGRYLEGDGKNDVAYRKYGENHSKLAELLDFVTITNTFPRRIYLTKLGKSFYNSDSKRKIQMLKSQIFRMDIVKDIIVKHSSGNFNLIEYLGNYLGYKTAVRRAPNIRKLFYFLYDNGLIEVKSVIETISRRRIT